MAAFGRNGRFMQPALALLGPQQLREMLDELGVATVADDEFHVFPATQSAVTVQKALWERCQELGVSLRFRCIAEALQIDQGRLVGLDTTAGPLPAERVVLATGGRGYPALGATGTGYALARQGGHAIVDPTPALVPLHAAGHWLRSCSGITFAGMRIWIDAPGHRKVQRTGDVLITHTGLSGPAVLDISADVAALLQAGTAVTLRMDLARGESPDRLKEKFARWQVGQGGKLVRTLVATLTPASLAALLCARAGIPETQQAAHLTRPQREALCDLLTALPVEIAGTAGFDEAMVTRGGVPLKEVNPHTLESRKLPGLFLAGELLDLDGPCGGYNLTWAFASGCLAGQSAAAE
jgi:predicted Rossmann fold flavoprotein